MTEPLSSNQNVCFPSCRLAAPHEGPCSTTPDYVPNLVARLRGGNCYCRMASEAAAEIERLRADYAKIIIANAEVAAINISLQEALNDIALAQLPQGMSPALYAEVALRNLRRGADEDLSDSK